MFIASRVGGRRAVMLLPLTWISEGHSIAIRRKVTHVSDTMNESESEGFRRALALVGDTLVLNTVHVNKTFGATMYKNQSCI